MDFTNVHCCLTHLYAWTWHIGELKKLRRKHVMKYHNDYKRMKGVKVKKYNPRQITPAATLTPCICCFAHMQGQTLYLTSKQYNRII